MKIYEVNGRKVWLNEPPVGYEDPKTEEPKAEPVVKAKKPTANKSRKAGDNK